MIGITFAHRNSLAPRGRYWRIINSFSPPFRNLTEMTARVLRSHVPAKISRGNVMQDNLITITLIKNVFEREGKKT